MTQTAIVVSGDYNPLAEVGPNARPLTMTPGGRLRVDTGGGDEGGQTVTQGSAGAEAWPVTGPLTNEQLGSAVVKVQTLGVEYEAVAASQTNQALGATGAVGDLLEGLLVIPATTSPGAITIKDGSNTAITVFTGGASSVSNLVPFYIPLGLKSGAGAWQVTTGANVSVLAGGDFT